MGESKGWVVASIITFIVAAVLAIIGFNLIDDYEIMSAIYCFSFSFVAILLAIAFGSYFFLSNILEKQRKLQTLDDRLFNMKEEQEKINQNLDLIRQKLSEMKD